MALYIHTVYSLFLVYTKTPVCLENRKLYSYVVGLRCGVNSVLVCRGCVIATATTRGYVTKWRFLVVHYSKSESNWHSRATLRTKAEVWIVAMSYLESKTFITDLPIFKVGARQAVFRE